MKQIFIKRKKSIVCVDRHTGRLRGRVPELCPHGSLNHLYGAFLPVFLWPNFLICLDHSPYLAYVMILSSLGQDRFYRTGVWVEHPLTSSPPLISNEPFCARVVREVSWLWEWEMCGLGKVRSSPSVVLLFSFWSFSPYRMNLQLLYHGLGKGGTSTFLPQDNRMAGSWLFPGGLSHRTGGQFGLPYLDSPAHHLSSRIAQICFLGNWAPRVTVSKHKCLSNLCLLQTCWCLISQHKPMATPEFMWKNTT